jgi:AraC-like DNA-binding protein
LKNISTAKNKNLRYLLLHFILIVLVLVSRLLDHIDLISINIGLTVSLIILTFLAYYLYIFNLKNNKSSFKVNLLIPIIFFIIINLFENEIFSDFKVKRFKIIRFSSETFIGISNILTYFLFVPYLLTLIWIKIQKTYNIIAKATNEKKIFKKWIIPYTLLITLLFIFSAFPSKFFGKNLVNFFYFINSVILFIMASYLLFSPKLLVNISKSFSLKTPNSLKSIELLAIDNLLLKKQYFLDTKMNLNKFTVIINKNPVKIRKILKQNNYENFKDYLNSFRVYYLKDLIDKGFLNTYSIDTALKKSGFGSHQTMSRTFKKYYNTTVKEYWQKAKST